MQKGERLRKESEFRAVYAQGKTGAVGSVVLRALRNDLERNRYAFVAGRKVGKAVVRNRVKRRLREIARLTPTKQGWDLVFIARAGAGGATYRDLDRSVKGLLRRAHILVDVDALAADGKVEA